jgi:hypothetical protein
MPSGAGAFASAPESSATAAHIAASIAARSAAARRGAKPGVQVPGELGVRSFVGGDLGGHGADVGVRGARRAQARECRTPGLADAPLDGVLLRDRRERADVEGSRRVGHRRVLAIAPSESARQRDVPLLLDARTIHAGQQLRRCAVGRELGVQARTRRRSRPRAKRTKRSRRRARRYPPAARPRPRCGGPRRGWRTSRRPCRTGRGGQAGWPGTRVGAPASASVPPSEAGGAVAAEPSAAANEMR